VVLHLCVFTTWQIYQVKRCGETCRIGQVLCGDPEQWAGCTQDCPRRAAEAQLAVGPTLDQKRL